MLTVTAQSHAGILNFISEHVIANLRNQHVAGWCSSTGTRRIMVSSQLLCTYRLSRFFLLSFKC